MLGFLERFGSYAPPEDKETEGGSGDTTDSESDTGSQDDTVRLCTRFPRTLTESRAS